METQLQTHLAPRGPCVLRCVSAVVFLCLLQHCRRGSLCPFSLHMKLYKYVNKTEINAKEQTQDFNQRWVEAFATRPVTLQAQTQDVFLQQWDEGPFKSAHDGCSHYVVSPPNPEEHIISYNM